MTSMKCKDCGRTWYIMATDACDDVEVVFGDREQIYLSRFGDGCPKCYPQGWTEKTYEECERMGIA